MPLIKTGKTSDGKDEEQDVNIEELLEFDMDDVEENYGGFQKTPISVALWRVASASLITVSEGKYLVAAYELECLKCYSIKSDEMAEDDMIGFKHNESIFIKDAAKDIGKVKGFMSKGGLEGKGKLKDLLEQFVGMEFVAKISHSRNKDDPDNPWVNMDYKGIRSDVAEFEAEIA